MKILSFHADDWKICFSLPRAYRKNLICPSPASATRETETFTSISCSITTIQQPSNVVAKRWMNCSSKSSDGTAQSLVNMESASQRNDGGRWRFHRKFTDFTVM